MDPVSAVIILGLVVAGLVALFTECIILMCQNCHRQRDESRQVSRVFPSLSRNMDQECYRIVTLDELKERRDFSVTDCCPICIEEYNSDSDDIVCLLACDHVFHKHCIDQWIHCNSLCPLCKHDMFEFVPQHSSETIVRVSSS